MSSPTPLRHTLKVRILVPALIACCSMLLMPFTALACGGFFSPDVSIDQNAERIIFTVNPGSITLYEQIHYSGTASDFAWLRADRETRNRCSRHTSHQGTGAGFMEDLF